MNPTSIQAERIYATGDVDWRRPFPGTQHWYVVLVLRPVGSGSRTVEIGVYGEPRPTMMHGAVSAVFIGPLPTRESAETFRVMLDRWVLLVPTAPSMDLAYARLFSAATRPRSGWYVTMQVTATDDGVQTIIRPTLGIPQPAVIRPTNGRGRIINAEIDGPMGEAQAFALAERLARQMEK